MAPISLTDKSTRSTSSSSSKSSSNSSSTITLPLDGRVVYSRTGSPPLAPHAAATAKPRHFP